MRVPYVRGMSYPGCAPYRRTPEQRADQRLAWERSDEAFFAAGACHILAFTFVATYPDAGYEIYALRSVGGEYPWHVYVSDGTWAFDFAGYTREEEVLAVSRSQSGGEVERLHIADDLTTFCENNDHRVPSKYWADPVPRAREYLARFDAPQMSPA
jgi:hypothetical protein